MGVGGCKTRFLPWTRQKYISTWKGSHWKLVGDWQKDSCRAKAVQGPHRIWLEWKRSDQKRSGTAWAETLPGAWAVRATYWAPQGWVLTLGRQFPWLVGGLEGLLGELWEGWTHSWKVHTSLLTPWARWRGWIKTVGIDGQFPAMAPVCPPA